MNTKINAMRYGKRCLLRLVAVAAAVPFTLFALNASAGQAGTADQAQAEAGMSQAGAVVGEVTFALGRAYVSRGVGESGVSKIKAGSAIKVGDEIQTRADSHIHIRFVDGGLISVRPSSQLSIDYYQYDPANPEASVIRFDLTEGRVRSISGKGAKANREKFRMNTPIAAIGVRGTDFVVSANASSVRALVNEGAIAVAAFSDTCLEQGVTRCDLNAVELRGDSKHIVEFNKMLTHPRLVPVGDKFVPELMEKDAAKLGALNEIEGPASDDEVEAEGLSEGAGEQVGLTGEDQADSQIVDVIGDMSDISTENELLKNDPDAAQVIADAVKDFVPEVAVDPEVLLQRKLVWGRWSNTVADTDRIVALRSDLSDRSVTVGTTELALFRSDSALTELQPGLGTVDFALVDAQATLEGASSLDMVQVRDGWLSINFGRRTFETGLELNHVLTSDMQFSADGAITKEGYFTSRTDTSRLLGATTLDGLEASYFFTYQNEHGTVSGITSWIGK